MASNPQADVKPLTLHAHVSGPNPHKVAIVLEFLKLPYQIRLWEFGGDFHKGVKGETFTRINENGRVPALEDPNTGVVAWESGAVINYLRRQYDTSNVLGPRGPTEQDRVDFEKWEYFLLTTLGPMSGQVAWFRSVLLSPFCGQSASPPKDPLITQSLGITTRQKTKTHWIGT